MKKIVILCLLIILMAPLGFSQVFAGGQAVLTFTNTEGFGSTTFIRANPIVGYSFGMFGAGVSFNYQVNFNPQGSNDLMRFGLFGDVRLLAFENFSVMGRASVYYVIRQMEFHEIELFGRGILEYSLTDRLKAFTSIGHVWFVPRMLDNHRNVFGAAIFPGFNLGFRFFF